MREIADLHTHILPGIDDGAADVSIAQKLLELERQDGVSAIALTPHFNCERQTTAAFIAQRAASFAALCGGTPPDDVHFKLGAEVCFSPMVAELDLAALCLEGTSYLLVELPMSHYPPWVKETFYELQLSGITPLIAHVERYPYLLQNPALLYELIEAGALAQINAGSLLRADARQKMCLRFLRWNLVHVLASDTHSPTKRPPEMRRALDYVAAALSGAAADRLCEQALCIYNGVEFTAASPHCPHKRLCFWT
ncbi:MAG: CpsB/CapC family capsule biosynthesis tyrosine phosphatase [Pygmaiobacter sp.]